jgi:type I restriction enzyme, S subunit
MIRLYHNFKEIDSVPVDKIPFEWSYGRLRYLTNIAKGRKAFEDYQDHSEGMIPYLSMDYLRNQTESPVFVKEDDSSIILVDENDLLILWDGSKAGEIVKSKKGALSSTMGKIQVINPSVDLKYLYYYLKSCEFFIQQNTIGMGIPHVSGDLLRSLIVPLPETNEQTQIARFLDYQTGLIDEIIEKKETLIALLKEKRSAIINELVTGKKVWNGNAWAEPEKVKDSGIEWLGEVPEEWDLVRLKRIVALNSNELDFKEQDVDFKIALENIESQTGKYIETDTEYQFEGLGNLFRKEDVLFNKLRPYLAKVYLADRNGIAVGELLVLTPSKSLVSKFLYYRMLSQSFIEIVNSSTYGAKMPRASWSFIGNILVPLPSLTEQEQIINYIDAKIEEFDIIIQLINIQIEKLKEYRQAIVSEAVTGKIDVRDWQPPGEQKA